MIRFKTPDEIGKMRRAGRALASVYAGIMEMVKPGTVTAELDRRIEDAIHSEGATPAFKGYKGSGGKPFPASACISIDEEVVHGIPSERRLQEGQIVGIDIGLSLDGWFADMAASFLVGNGDENKQRLHRITREALYRGIAQAHAGRSIMDIGGAVQDWVEQHGCYVIRELVGHGVGAQLHEEPAVPNYRSAANNVLLRPGMTLAIEPMVATGTWRVKTLSDGWTAVTMDGSPAGHFEHTVLVTDGEPEILTLLPDNSDPWEKINA